MAAQGELRGMETPSPCRRDGSASGASAVAGGSAARSRHSPTADSPSSSRRCRAGRREGGLDLRCRRDHLGRRASATRSASRSTTTRRPTTEHARSPRGTCSTISSSSRACIQARRSSRSARERARPRARVSSVAARLSSPSQLGIETCGAREPPSGAIVRARGLRRLGAGSPQPSDPATARTCRATARGLGASRRRARR